MSRLYLLLAILAVALPVHAGTLEFDEALRLAERRAPALTAATAEEAAARAARRAAGTLPDPRLFVGLENYPVSGAQAWAFERDAMTMQKFGLMQELPNGAKRAAARAAGEAEIALAGAQYGERRSALRTATAVAWIEAWHLRRRHALLDELERENATLTAAVQAAVAAEQGAAADAVVPLREAVRTGRSPRRARA